MNDSLITLAAREAKQGSKIGDGGPFGAVITDNKGNIISIKHNTVLKDNDPTAHAEVNAIREACKILNTHDLSDCTIYSSCEPCPMCLSAIIWSNIKKVYYGNTMEDAENIGFRDKFIYDFINNKNKDVLDLECIDRDDTIKAFNEYMNKDDKTIY